MGTATDLDLLRHLTESMAVAVRAAHAESLDAATPCPDWCVRDLLDHVTGGNRFTVDLLAGYDGHDALDRAHASFGTDHDPLAAVVESGNRQLDSFTRSGALDGDYRHLFGELSGTHVLRLRLHDLGIHMWDLEQSLRPGSDIDSAYAQWAVDELADPESLTAQTFAAGAGFPATPQELLVAFGRRPLVERDRAERSSRS